MKIVLPGGSGHIGNILATHFHQRGDQVVVLSRSAAKNPGVLWNGMERLSATGLANSMAPMWSSISPDAASTAVTTPRTEKRYSIRASTPRAFSAKPSLNRQIRHACGLTPALRRSIATHSIVRWTRTANSAARSPTFLIHGISASTWLRVGRKLSSPRPRLSRVVSPFEALWS